MARARMTHRKLGACCGNLDVAHLIFIVDGNYRPRACLAGELLKQRANRRQLHADDGRNSGFEYPLFFPAIDSIAPKEIGMVEPMGYPSLRGGEHLVESSARRVPWDDLDTTLLLANQSKPARGQLENVAPSLRRGIHSSRKWSTAVSVIGIPLTVIRSRKSMRWGDVYLPTLRPFHRSNASAVATTLPFPLVPAT